MNSSEKHQITKTNLKYTNNNSFCAVFLVHVICTSSGMISQEFIWRKWPLKCSSHQHQTAQQKGIFRRKREYWVCTECPWVQIHRVSLYVPMFCSRCRRSALPEIGDRVVDRRWNRDDLQKPQIDPIPPTYSTNCRMGSEDQTPWPTDRIHWGIMTKKPIASRKQPWTSFCQLDEEFAGDWSPTVNCRKIEEGRKLKLCRDQNIRQNGRSDSRQKRHIKHCRLEIEKKETG